MGVCNCSMFCCTLLYVHSSIAIILMGKRELVALLNLSSWCLVMVERQFLAIPQGCLQFVIVVFPDNTLLLFFKHKTNQNMFPPPYNIQKYIWGRIDTIYNSICYDNMFSNAFKSLLRLLKENSVPYKCRLFGNSQFATNCYTVVLYNRMFKYYWRKKSALLLSG